MGIPLAGIVCVMRRSFMYATPAFLSLWRTARRASAHVRLRKLPFKSVSRAFAVVAADVRAACRRAAAFPPLQPRACPGYIPALFPRFWAGTWVEICSLPGRRARPAGARRPAVRTDAISAFRFVWNPHQRTQRHEAAPLSAPPRGTVHSFTSSYANTTDFPLTVESLADAFAFARSISTSPPREPSCLSA